MWKCPESNKHKKFGVTAHVTQDWIVNEFGDFTSCTNVCVEVTHRPNKNDVATCVTCGAEAVWVEQGRFDIQEGTKIVVIRGGKNHSFVKSYLELPEEFKSEISKVVEVIVRDNLPMTMDEVSPTSVDIKSGAKKIIIRGDRNEPLISSFWKLPINVREELESVISVTLFDGYKLSVHEAE